MVNHDLKLNIRYFFVLRQSQKNMSGVRAAFQLQFIYDFTNSDKPWTVLNKKLWHWWIKLGLKKVLTNFLNSYWEKLFNEEVIHLHKDEFAESDDKDTELVELLDAHEVSPVFRHCKAAVLVLNENDSGWEGSSVRHDLNISVCLLPSASQSEILASKETYWNVFAQ